MKKSSRISFINIVALLGYALAAFAVFMGAMLTTGGSIGAALAIALGSVVVLYLIIRGACYAKSADTDINRWKKVEIVLVVLFWLAAIFPSFYISHFVRVLGDGERIHAMAADDAGRISRLFSEYELFENNALSITRVGLETAIGQPMDQPLEAYMRSASISSPDDIDTWMNTQRGLLLGNTGVDGFSYISFRENVDSVINNWLSAVNASDVMFMAVHGNDLDDLAPDVAERLTLTSSQAKLPGVEFINGVYSASPLEQKTVLTAPSMEFADSIHALDGSVMGYVLAAVIMFLIFLNYIMTRRSGLTQLQSYDLSEGNSL